ncbi:hypothetical protein Kfla_6993 [Kribbella flavida DSM 17836]|uniref:DUF8175 domain-containing protein n=1 Tax=Kribbella flavida (strain DSM 17836 / JCM 10339 / NBRC 14399) TaxID=479435 RepID=D2Q3V9_KRIFD|nr:hypothetical protein [Kribbella flavida]ADB35981.1 hypothetical protein Kfla_6993 [Kribbella flavida DSM 17836]
MAWFSGRDSSGAEDDGTAAGSPWESRGVVASAIVLGAVAVCAAVWLVVGGSDDPSTQPAPTATPTLAGPTDDPTDESTEPPATPDPTASTPTAPVRPSGVGGCRTKNPDQRIPREAPSAVSWQFETNMLIPLQRQGGPALEDANGLRHCFAHSPTGAVLAAMVTLGQIRNPELTEAVLRNRIAPGPGRTRALAATRTSPTPRNTGQTSQFAGFKVVDYLPNRAIVSVAVRLDSQKVAGLPVTLLWTGGDWKLVLQADGSFNGEVAPDVLQSLEGYVRFGGA